MESDLVRIHSRREDEGVKTNLEVATYGQDLTRGALKARPSLLWTWRLVGITLGTITVRARVSKTQGKILEVQQQKEEIQIRIYKFRRQISRSEIAWKSIYTNWAKSNWKKNCLRLHPMPNRPELHRSFTTSFPKGPSTFSCAVRVVLWSDPGKGVV